MTPPPELLSVALACAVAGVVQGSLGFGFGLVAISGSAFVLSMADAVPAISALGVWVYAGMLWVLRRELVVRDAAVMLVGLGLGVPFGVLLLRFGDPTWLLVGLGLVLLVGTAIQAFGGAPKAGGGGWAWAAGLAGGVLGGSVGSGGPPVVLFVASRPWSPARGTACLQLIFFVMTAVQLVGYTASGLLGREELVLAAGGAPAAVLGLAIGQTAFRRIPEQWFRRTVQACLACLGVWFVVRGIAASV